MTTETMVLQALLAMIMQGAQQQPNQMMPLTPVISQPIDRTAQMQAEYILRENIRLREENALLRSQSCGYNYMNEPSRGRRGMQVSPRCVFMGDMEVSPRGIFMGH